MTKKMTPLIQYKNIDFPPVGPTDKVKLTRFFETIGEFMETDIEVEEVTTMRVKVNASRPDVITMINKVASNERRKEKESKSV